MSALVIMVNHGARLLPQPLAHALAQLRRRRFHLVPAEPESGTIGRRYPVTFTRSLLARLPSSPALQDALAAAPATEALAGQAWLGADKRPRLALQGVGGVWCFALPGRRGTFAVLRELRAPQDLRPASSRLVEVAPGVVERRHRIPLRYHPGAWLIIGVTALPSGRVSYDACIWHAGRRRTNALWWEETQRVIELFRDLASSWFWVEAPPARPARATSPGRPAPVPFDTPPSETPSGHTQEARPSA